MVVILSKRFSNIKSRGYTLIEVLIGISIIGIIFSVGLSGYREFSRRQALTGVSKQIKADIRLTQQLALTGQKPQSVTCTTLNGYIFSRESQNNYRILASCTSSLGVVSTVEVKNVDLGTDISFSSTNSTLLFKVLGQGTNLSSANIITLSHTSGSQIIITVGVGGDVR